MSITPYQHLPSYISFLARRFWSLDRKDLKIEYIICMKTLDGIGTLQYAVFTNSLLMLVSQSQLKWKINLNEISGLDFKYKTRVYQCYKCEDIIMNCQNNCKLHEMIEKIDKDKGNKGSIT